MSQRHAVSVVIPSLGDEELLRIALPLLKRECDSRGVGDEVLVIDDTGRAVLAPFLAAEFPWVRSIANAANLGFAQTARVGAQAAQFGLLFIMNPDIRVHAGFLEPLVAELERPEVHSAVPRILLNGDPAQIESVMEIGQRNGFHFVRQRGLEGEAQRFSAGVFPVAYGVGGAILLRREEFLDRGFDALFEPFYHEDTDLGLSAWWRGRRVHLVADSVVEHHHRGSIRKRIPATFVRAIIERNLLLLQWKFLDDPQARREHMGALYRLALDAYLLGDREQLIWLRLALDRLTQLATSRAQRGPGQGNLADLIDLAERSRPT